MELIQTCCLFISNARNSSTVVQGISNAVANGVTIVHAAGNDDTSVPNYLDFLGDRVLSAASASSSDFWLTIFLEKVPACIALNMSQF